MKRQMPVGELALVIGTRALLGGGLGLLLSEHLNDDQRKTMGWTLFLVGALSTIPIFIDLFGRSQAMSIGEAKPQNGNPNADIARPIPSLA